MLPRIAVAIMAVVGPAFAQQPPSDPKDLEAFVDGVIGVTSKLSSATGTVFVAVKDGQILLAKGYGYQDPETKAPVDPSRTLFRIASLSKLFTATAVMQLYEQGKLDLNTDVNIYLSDVHIPGTFPQPITLTHLLTHTAGFDERAIGTCVRVRNEAKPLGSYLAGHMPGRCRPPGELIAYSNTGFALVGYTVECVADMPFADYAAAHIFEPLGMNNTYFDLPDSEMPYLAKSFLHGDASPTPDYYLQDFPAGAAVSTGEDIARFMIAHLQLGQYNGARILGEDTVRMMHARQFSHDPRLNGICFPFFERRRNGVRTIEHRGDLPGFASSLILFPDYNFGFFVSSTNPSSLTRTALADQLMIRYFPANASEPPPSSGDRAAAQAAAGTYRFTRYASRTLEKLNTLTSQLQVSANEDGSITLQSDDPARVSPRGGQFYADESRDLYVLFAADSANGRDMLYMNQNSYEKLFWYETARVQAGYLLAILIIFASVVLLWPLIGIKGIWKREGRLNHEAPSASCVGWVLAACNLVLLLGLGAGLFLIDEIEFMYGMPETLIPLLYLPFFTAVLTVFALGYALAAWWNRYWTWKGRMHYTLLVAAAISIYPFAYYWNLLGFNW
ncbi:MAG: hypothetical protein AMXMBFR84_23250 [Candidatus Hydrogenedentota bacterium]